MLSELRARKRDRGGDGPSRVFDANYIKARPIPKRGRVAMADDTREQKLAQMISAKLEQGYRIESQTGTEAVLFTESRRHWFGLFAGSGAGARQIISIDEQGTATTRKL